MINFISNMQQATNVVSESNTARKLIEAWVAERGLDYADAESFLADFRVSNVNTNVNVTEGSLDAPLGDGQTLAIYTHAVATGGAKGA